MDAAICPRLAEVRLCGWTVGLWTLLLLPQPMTVNCWTICSIIITSELIFFSRTANCLQGDEQNSLNRGQLWKCFPFGRKIYSQSPNQAFRLTSRIALLIVHYFSLPLSSPPACPSPLYQPALLSTYGTLLYFCLSSVWLLLTAWVELFHKHFESDDIYLLDTTLLFSMLLYAVLC